MTDLNPEDLEAVARAICDAEWEGSQPPFNQKPPSFGERYRAIARAAISALPPAPNPMDTEQKGEG